jgi:hypothetical protein
MERHANLSLPEQQRALENEPGFHELPRQTQQAERDQLVKLNNMTPEQRSRVLERTETLNEMTPAQRQQFRGVLQRYAALPVDRRRLVGRAFRDLREMPPAERQTVIASDRFRTMFSDNERATLSNLFTVEPYLPQRGPAETP